MRNERGHQQFDHYPILGQRVHVGDTIEYSHQHNNRYRGVVESINMCPEIEQCSDNECESKIYLRLSDPMRVSCVRRNFNYIKILKKADNIIHKVVIV